MESVVGVVRLRESKPDRPSQNRNVFDLVVVPEKKCEEERHHDENVLPPVIETTGCFVTVPI